MNDFFAKMRFWKTTSFITLVCVSSLVLLPHFAKAQYIDGVYPLAEKVVELMKEGNENELLAMFAPEMKEKIPAGQLSQIWPTLMAQMGPLEHMTKYSLQAVGSSWLIIQICKFEKMELALQLSINGEGLIQGMFFIPPPAEKFADVSSYVNKDAIKEEKVVFDMGDIQLPGFFTFPVKAKKFPLVILVHGSGAHDADETLGPNKIFRDIAQGLASRGIGVVRYEKRNKNHAHTLDPQTISPKQEVTDDFQKVLLAATHFMGVDKKRIFVMGHSLGGFFAPFMASENPSLKGAIVMAGNARPLHHLVMEQIRYLIPQQVSDVEEQEKMIQEYQAQADRIDAGDYDLDTPHTELMMGISAAYWKFLSGYNPVQTMSQLPQHALVIIAERDYQVPVVEFKHWKEGLGQKKNAKVVLLPGLNHAFMSGEGLSKPEEYFKEGNVDISLITEVEQWIKSVK